MIVVQMHGEPGSGKTTLARALAPRIPATHVDKDLLMSAIMRSGVPRDIAGPTAYEVVWDLSASLLRQGHSVVIDSPAFWPIIEQRGEQIAEECGARYCMIETICSDHAEVERRLESREALPANPRQRVDWLAMPGTQAPIRPRLTLDTVRPIEELVDIALAYLTDLGKAA